MCREILTSFKEHQPPPGTERRLSVDKTSQDVIRVHGFVPHHVLGIRSSTLDRSFFSCSTRIACSLIRCNSLVRILVNSRRSPIGIGVIAIRVTCSSLFDASARTTDYGIVRSYREGADSSELPVQTAFAPQLSVGVPQNRGVRGPDLVGPTARDPMTCVQLKPQSSLPIVRWRSRIVQFVDVHVDSIGERLNPRGCGRVTHHQETPIRNSRVFFCAALLLSSEIPFPDHTQ